MYLKLTLVIVKKEYGKGAVAHLNQVGFVASIQAVCELKRFTKSFGRIVGIQLRLLLCKETIPALRWNTTGTVIRPSQVRTHCYISLGVLRHGIDYITKLIRLLNHYLLRKHDYSFLILL